MQAERVLSDTVLSKGPCPKCGSKDNLVTYDDGHSHCFSPGCGHWTSSSDAPEAPTTGQVSARKTGGNLMNPSEHSSPYRDSKTRKLTADSFKKYGYFIGRYSGDEVQVAPYYSQDGDLVAQKVRLPGKEFSTLKGPGYEGLEKCRLFGHQVYGDRFDRSVVVTEGELDAISVAQVLDFKRPCVSVNTGAGNAAKCLKANYLWLDRFQEIILWFDDDEPGRAAAEECAKLFKVGKIKIARAPGCKDASDCLQKAEPGLITEAVYGAVAWRPQGIVNGADCANDVRAPRDKVQSFSYPPSMEMLQQMSGGIHVGEVAYQVAGTGVGKSTQTREMIYDLTHNQGVKVGLLSFEDTRRDAQILLMSVHASERLQLIPLPDPTSPGFEEAAKVYDAKMLPLHAAVFGSRLIELFDAETAEWSFEAVLSYLRYMAKALDCKVLIVDPLSFVAALSEEADERKQLDKVAANFAQLAKELGVAIQVIHHLRRTQGVPHEEGASTSLNELRSSGGLANFASFVVGWERNNQADGESWRVTQSRVLKPHRMIGKSGLADVLFYGENGRLIKSPIPFPPIGKPGATEDGSVSRKQGFSPVSEY